MSPLAEPAEELFELICASIYDISGTNNYCFNYTLFVILVNRLFHTFLVRLSGASYVNLKIGEGNMKNIFADEEYMLWRFLFQVSHLLAKARQKELTAYRVTPRKAAILLISQATGGQVTAYKIARWLVVEPQTVSEVISRMENEGLVKKIKNHDSRKSVRIQLTDKGQELCREVEKLDSVHKIISSLATEERQELTRILKILRDMARKEIGLVYEMPFPPF